MPQAVKAAIGRRDTVIVNALGPQFHRGLEPSRYGRPGRVPGSINVPAATLVDPATKGFTTLADAAAKFAAQGVSKDKRMICYCGGGISATIDLFLLHQLGYDDITLYDASMGEWAKDAVAADRDGLTGGEAYRPGLTALASCVGRALTNRLIASSTGC